MTWCRWTLLTLSLGLLGSCQPTPAEEAEGLSAQVQPLEPAPQASEQAAQAKPVVKTKASSSLIERIPPPAGYRRIPVAPGSFGAWLRARPLKPEGSPVLLYSGHKKRNQGLHVAVLDVDVGSQDLQQCADAIMRLRAEYLFESGCQDRIAFNFTSGDRAAWSQWKQGMRPKVSGSNVTWAKTADPKSDYAAFRRYLDTVFTYAGSASLEGELGTVKDPAQVELGDVVIEGGFPGHGVIVMDVAESAAGERVFLLAQSYMPAQSIHILKAFDGLGPWYKSKADGPLKTPEWNFEHTQLKRFEGGCAPTP